MNRLLQQLVTSKTSLGLAAILGLTSVLTSPQQAKADWRVGIDLRDGWHQPAYETRTTRVWVEPVYRTVCERQWVEATYQTVCERVWVPDRYEDRRVIRYQGYSQHVEYVRVLAEPAHYEERPRQVLVAPAHWQDVQQQVVVSPGHWECREERVALCDPHSSYSRLRFEFGGR